MYNFDYYVPTEIIFGKDAIASLGGQVSKYGKNVLLAYGGGSIKRSGLYDTVVSILSTAGATYWELPGIEPNPRIESVRQGVELCREHSIDLVLAVGGGSTIDCAKVIAAGAKYQGDPWDLVLDPDKIQDALPLGSILTLSATGSEMNGNAVITNPETTQKLGTRSNWMKPKFSILDPTYTFTLPEKQTVAGVADIMSHILEVYFTDLADGAFLQDRMCEAMLKTCIEYGPVLLKEPSNYNARANIMWTSSLAISGVLAAGKNSEWTVHPMEHELSAFFDVTHGEGLAILTPPWMRFVLSDKTVKKFSQYARNVWGLTGEDSMELANAGIDKTEEFFLSLGIPMTLREVGITDEKSLKVMAEAAVKNKKGPVGNYVPLEAKDIEEIYKMAF